LTKAHVTPYGVALGCGMRHGDWVCHWIGPGRVPLACLGYRMESMWPGAWRTLVRCLSVLFTMPRLVAQTRLQALRNKPRTMQNTLKKYEVVFLKFIC